MTTESESFESCDSFESFTASIQVESEEGTSEETVSQSSGGKAHHQQSESDDVVIAAEGQDGTEQEESKSDPLGLFGKYLPLWVLLCMVFGTLLGVYWPALPQWLAGATVAQISLPVTVLLWLMIYPMLLQIEWRSLRDVRKRAGGVALTTVVNWAVQPFVMYGLAILFIQVAYDNLLEDEDQEQYIAGLVVLGGSPCTAMVFVWSMLANGDAAYTLVQVAINDLILLVAYVPTAVLLLGISEIKLPWDTVILSVVLFVFVPLLFAVATRYLLLRRANGKQTLLKLIEHFKPVSIVALLLTLVLIFVFQGQSAVDNWSHILLLMVPISLQTILVFLLTYSLAYFFRLEHSVAGPAAFVGSSNFFELGVAVAIAVWGLDSGAALANVVGVLVEVPVMLTEVWIVNKTAKYFARRRQQHAIESEEAEKISC